MKYAFIDYENIHSLDGLALQDYGRIYLFLGANQTNIKLTEKFNDEINVVFVTVREISDNNVDFHIAYYLGRLDATVDKNIEFHIFSKDKGYDGILHFIQSQRESRVCNRKVIEVNAHCVDKTVLALPSPIEVEKEKVNQVFLEYKLFMSKRERRHLPTKNSSLRNNIHNQTSLKGFDKKTADSIISKVINKLSSEKLLKINNLKVSYP